MEFLQQQSNTEIISLLSDEEDSNAHKTTQQTTTPINSVFLSQPQSSEDKDEESETDEVLEDWGHKTTMNDVASWLDGVRGVFSSETTFVESLTEVGIQIYEDWKDKEVDVKVKRSAIAGFGLFADEDIDQGDVIME